MQLNTQRLDFALTALFLVLTIEQAKAVKRAFPFVVAVISAILAMTFYPPQMLFIGLALSFLVIGFHGHRLKGKRE